MRSKKTVLLSLIFALLFVVPTQGAILYVSDMGDGSDGLSWQTAFKAPSEVLASASEGDEIWIKEGTYLDTGVFVSSVSIYGGFVGTEAETDFGLRDPIGNPSVIDGSGSGNSVLVLESVQSATVDGITITGGEGLLGGGIRMSRSTVLLNDCILENNQAETSGGAVFAFNDSDLQVSNSIIRDNSTTSTGNRCGGGGFSIGSQSRGKIEDSQFFRNNTMCSGGAINALSEIGASAVVVNCTFERNLSGGSGHAVKGDMLISDSYFAENGDPSNLDHGNAINVGGFNLDSSVQHCVVQDNYCGGISISYGDVQNCRITDNMGRGLSGSNSEIDDCEIARNRIGIDLNNSTISGCIVQDHPDVGIRGGDEIRRCIVSGNSLGGIASDEPVLIENCLIFDNRAFYGAGVSVDPDGSEIRYCTIVDNTAEEAGGGIFINSHPNGVEEIAPRVVGSIIWGNQSDSPVYNNIGHSEVGFPPQEESGPPIVSFSLIGGGFTGEGNLDLDPMFVDGIDGNYQLLFDSPCIDSASTEGPNSDLSGVIRPIDIAGAGRDGSGTFDMGAYEFNFAITDLNRDGRVDALDLLIFQEDWYRHLNLE